MGTAKRIYTALVPHRRGIEVVLDAAVWVASIALALWFRYDGAVPADRWRALPLVALTIAALQLGFGVSSGLYLGRWSFGSFEEVRELLRTVVLTAGGFYAINLVLGWVPRSTPPMAAFIAVVVMSGFRYAWRLHLESKNHPSADARRLIVFGAGDAGTQIVTGMLRDRRSRYLPVALLDDDPRKAYLSVRGVPVKGTRADVARVAQAVGAHTVLIAMPSADGALVREVSSLALRAGLDVLVVPTVSELYDGQVREDDIRPVGEADLLGRGAVDVDEAAIGATLTGKRVLVTGAGGTVGAELVRQIRRFGPAELLLLDRDEAALASAHVSVGGTSLIDDSRFVVADVRDGERMREVFQTHAPQVVVHAAALKHVSLLEDHPVEALKTNVLGVQNILDAVAEFPVERLVNVSSDRAANPLTVLGWSKRIGERLVADADSDNDGTFVSVRVGNVTSSKSSVIAAFRAQIDAGGPVRVSDPEATRYFVNGPNAAKLVLQAAATVASGTLAVIDMGDAVRIAELAQRLIDAAPRPIAIAYTGLRAGEKLHEELVADDEVAHPTTHPLVTEVEVPPLAANAVFDLGGAAFDARSLQRGGGGAPRDGAPRDGRDALAEARLDLSDASGLQLQRVVLVGGGGHAADVLQCIDAINAVRPSYHVIGIVDDNPDVSMHRFAGRGLKLLGGVDDVASLATDVLAVLAIGYPKPRRAVAARLREHGVRIAPALVHPTAVVGDGVELGEGTVVLGPSRISDGAEIGEGVLVSYLAAIGHDTVIGDSVSVMPGAMVSGACTVGEAALLGARCVVLQGLEIGSESTVGARALATADLPQGAKVVVGRA